MMVTEDCHRSIEAVTSERQRLGIALQHRRGTSGALGNHHGGGLDRHHIPPSRLVGTRARGGRGPASERVECFR